MLHINTISNRVKYLRKILLNISQEEFGTKIGIVKSGISNYEKGARNMSDRTIADICREFNVNENWLRNGIEPIFIEKSSENVDLIADEYNLNEKAKGILKGFIELDDAKRDLFIEVVESLFIKNPNNDNIEFSTELTKKPTLQDRLKDYEIIDISNNEEKKPELLKNKLQAQSEYDM